MVILLIGGVICLFSVGLILKSYKGDKKIIFPVLILLTWAIRYTLYYISDVAEDNFFIFYPAILAQNLLLLDGVFLYWYVKDVTFHSFRWSREFWHLIPFSLFSLISLNMLLFIPSELLYAVTEEELQLAEKGVEQVQVSGFLLLLGIEVFNIAYGVSSLFRVNRFQELLKNNLSSFNRFNIRWLRNIVISWLVLFTVPSIIYLTTSSAEFSNPFLDSSIYALRIVLAILFSYQFVTRELIQKEQAALLPLESGAPVNESIDSAEELTQGSESKEKTLYSSLVAFMKTNKVYEKPDISLNGLSAEFGEPAYRVSKIINDFSGGSYHDFINNFRIEAVKKDLKNSSEQIIQIAYKNGFNSKSTFNDVFKKQVGLTPTAYRRMNQP